MEKLKIFIFTRNKFNRVGNRSREVPTYRQGDVRLVRRIKTEGEKRKIKAGDEVVYNGKKYIVSVVNGHILTIYKESENYQSIHVPIYKVVIRVKNQYCGGMVLRIK